MELVKTNRFYYMNSLSEPTRKYQIDRYLDYKIGDAVAVIHGNVAKIEHLTNETNKKNILGKITGIISELP